MKTDKILGKFQKKGKIDEIDHKNHELNVAQRNFPDPAVMTPPDFPPDRE